MEQNRRDRSSHFKLNEETGAKCLIVYYNQDNFDEAIQKGLSDHNLKEGQTTVIALPAKPKVMRQKALNF